METPKMGGAVFAGPFPVVVGVERLVCFSIVRQEDREEGARKDERKERGRAHNTTW